MKSCIEPLDILYSFISSIRAIHVTIACSTYLKLFSWANRLQRIHFMLFLFFLYFASSSSRLWLIMSSSFSSIAGFSIPPTSIESAVTAMENSHYIKNQTFQKQISHYYLFLVLVFSPLLFSSGKSDSRRNIQPLYHRPSNLKTCRLYVCHTNGLICYQDLSLFLFL